jgi:hypothetical protein
VTPPGLSFEKNTVVGTRSTPVNVTLTNTGTTPLAITAITTKGDFRPTNKCGTSLAPGALCRVAIEFAPTLGGIRSGNLAIRSGDPGSPRVLTLVGVSTGVNVVPGTLTFPAQPVGTPSAPQSLSVTNAENVPLVIGSALASGDFAQSNNCPNSLLPKGTCTFNVTFSPSTTGTRTGSITINDSDGSSPQIIPLKGTGD